MRDFMTIGRSLAVAERGMAATSHPQGDTGCGGYPAQRRHAVDAAVAAVAVQGVVEPQMTGIGGDCFALYAPRAGRPIALNGSGRTPAGTDPEKYATGEARDIPPTSPEAVTVPGAIDAWCRLISEHGRLSLEQVLRPAITAAEQGFCITPRVAADWQRFRTRVESDPDAAAQFLPGGACPRSAMFATSRSSARRYEKSRSRAGRRSTRGKWRTRSSASCAALAGRTASTISPPIAPRR